MISSISIYCLHIVIVFTQINDFNYYYLLFLPVQFLQRSKLSNRSFFFIHKQELLRVRVNLGVMLMKSNSILPDSLGLESHHPGHSFCGVLAHCKDAVGIFYSTCRLGWRNRGSICDHNSVNLASAICILSLQRNVVLYCSREYFWIPWWKHKKNILLCINYKGESKGNVFFFSTAIITATETYIKMKLVLCGSHPSFST